MRPRERAFVAALCAERAGLRLDHRPGYLMESALAPVARREGFLSTSDLVRAARDRADDRLSSAIVEALAPAQTAFFRDPEVLGAALDALPFHRGEPLRIWSAGCGAGQEVYSLAMLLAERRSPAAVEITGSDLSQRLIDKAEAGLYSPFEVQQGLSAGRLVEHFEQLGEGFAVKPRLRAGLRWRRENLLQDAPEAGRYDLVLGRYLLSSLGPSARTRVLALLRAALKPGGCLLLSPHDAIAAYALGLEPLGSAPGLFRQSAAVAQAA
ncbi:MAG TPA: CheR family methyltransferase [Phenylobacterium sp.]|uniref:CheR family methyltransferase n=1 Tax=Phenylobacterium sp. TaxID=1871053 RepID=UPI002B69EB92|nr:CheR family methyltransferase [Phenylobacterium sp.]HSV01573.1 CheR family methyltransferase [Phenylobacterium sp.]